jgi:hypothetical protein
MKDAIGTSPAYHRHEFIIGICRVIFFISSLIGHCCFRSPPLPLPEPLSAEDLDRICQGEKLKKWFGWFVLVMGIYIIIHEIFPELIIANPELAGLYLTFIPTTGKRKYGIFFL